jgi:pilus assembly protein CpaB
MKLVRVLVLVVALAAGGIAAWLALNMAPGGSAPTVVEVAPPLPTQEVLVAASDVGMGQQITADNVRWQHWPDEAVNESYIRKATSPNAVEELQGTIVRSQFIAGEPIRHVKLARAESGFLSAMLPSGKRAVAVRVSAQNTAGGFILPNDRVDVIQTVSQQTTPDTPAETVSRTILTNVKVLAIDQTVEEQDGEAVVVGKTATLELDPGQAELITSAEVSGTLSLSLRSVEDTDEVATAREERRSSTVKVIRSGRSQSVSTR